MRVLVAPDAFKGTLTAREAAAVIADAFAGAGFDTDSAPIADGGDGTLDVLLAHGYAARFVDAVDAAGRPRRARIGVRGRSAVIELAEICGLVTVADLPLDGRHRTTLGLGLAARAAIDAGCRDITLCVGGSASVDGGIGLLTGLGFAVLDETGAPVTPDLVGMVRAARITAPALVGIDWRVLADVTTPIAGSESTAMVFGAQKGLDARDRVRGDAALQHWAALLETTFGVDVRELPGGGAAGGVAAGAHAALGAELVPGSAAIAELVDLRDRIRSCDLVVTGEGSLDEQSVLGKGTGLVVELARESGRPIGIVAGSIALDDERLASMGVTAWASCADVAGSAPSARLEPARWLAVAARSLALAATGGAHD